MALTKISPKNKPVKNRFGDVIYTGDLVKLTKPAFVNHKHNTEEFAGKLVDKAVVESIMGKMVFLTHKLGGYWSWDVGEVRKVMVRKKVKR